MGARGLRNAFEITKGSGLRWKIKTLYWELRYAWQRAWRGYDFTDVFELGYNFAAKMPELLREFKKYNVALFADRETHTIFTEEETDKVLDDMIFFFENCDEDHVYKRLFGVDFWEDEYDNDKWKVVETEIDRCQTEAMRLFSKWVWDLWY